MIKQTPWLDRKFPSIEDNGLLPDILERLYGTIVRVEMIARLTPKDILLLKPDSKWSIQEEIGHLSDLEPLWLKRVNEFIQEQKILSAADMSNHKTHTAQHNSREIFSIIEDFKTRRMVFIQTIESLPEKTLIYQALHPRLNTPMRVIDLCNFVAEHDDHHLVCIRRITQKTSGLT